MGGVDQEFEVAQGLGLLLVVPKPAAKDALVVIKSEFNFLIESEVADFQKQ